MKLIVGCFRCYHIIWEGVLKCRTKIAKKLVSESRREAEFPETRSTASVATSVSITHSPSSNDNPLANQGNRLMSYKPTHPYHVCHSLSLVHTPKMTTFQHFHVFVLAMFNFLHHLRLRLLSVLVCYTLPVTVFCTSVAVSISSLV
jgi:hypothetical protein